MLFQPIGDRAVIDLVAGTVKTQFRKGWSRGMAHARPPWPASATTVCRLIALFCIAFVVALHRPAAAEVQANRIQIEYFAPTNPAYYPIYDLLKERRTLEKLQEIFSPFRLPIELTLRTGDCDGAANAWYDRPAISICYEYVAEILQGLPQEAIPEGIMPSNCAMGQFFYIVAHEMGHAVFDMFKVPVLGNEEDAADQFSTYVMLHFGKEQARALIGNAAYSYHRYVQNTQVTAPLAAFSDVHGAPAQRFYNLLCLAYGADPKLFADVVDKGYLPSSRATGCKREYDRVAFAFDDLISPHVDHELAQRVMDRTWLPELRPPSSHK
jgi:hypothetical protein